MQHSNWFICISRSGDISRNSMPTGRCRKRTHRCRYRTLGDDIELLEIDSERRGDDIKLLGADIENIHANI